MKLTADNLNEIGITCFKEKKNFNRILYDKGYNEIEILIIPEGVTEIEEFCFSDCTKIKKVVLPESLKHIHNWAFRGCTSLEEINMPKNLEIIDSSVFMHTKIKSLILPENFIRAKNKAFAFMEELEEIAFKNKDTILERDMFVNDLKLKTINFPSNLKTITSNMFFNCLALEKIHLENIEEINKTAFFNNINLKRIYLSENLKKIDENFIHFDYSFFPDKTFTEKNIVDICGNLNEDIYETIKNNQFINLKIKSLDILLNESKSFKEINDLYKNSEEVK